MYTKIKDKLKISVCGVGYMGYGDYISTQTPQYKCWHNMLERCYKNNDTNNQTYLDCIVCDEWHNFQNFAKWYDNNYYKISNEQMCLDKDILIKKNKIYSPENCIFVTQSINKLFLDSKKTRGAYPIGCSTYRNKIVSRITIDNKTIHLGYYNILEDAFNVYKFKKEAYIKEIADKYKKQIPEILYNAMYNYKIEITD